MWLFRQKGGHSKYVSKLQKFLLYISSFIEIGQKMTVIIGKSIFWTKISQAWPMVTHVHHPFKWLRFRLISTHISSFIEIGQKMTKLLSKKAIFWSVRHDPWSWMSREDEPITITLFENRSDPIFFNFGSQPIQSDHQNPIIIPIRFSIRSNLLVDPITMPIWFSTRSNLLADLITKICPF